jgi:leader peptidase (prepilin peptidase)/N-methyltransferase
VFVAVVALSGVFGLLIGSFLNVVIWRVPRGESVARPPSHCPSCEHEIRARDNVPVLSWLVLRGKCRDCANPISARYPLVELATGLLFAGLAARFGAHAVLPAYLYLGAVSVALALIDIDTKKLPNALTLPSYVVGAVLLGVAAFVDHDAPELLRAAEGMAALYAVYGLLWFAVPGAMGFGDVKLAGVLGLYLGYLGWRVWAVGLLGGFFAGGFFGIALLAMRRAGRKTKIPYGPFMVVGAFIAIFAGAPIARFWLGNTP